MGVTLAVAALVILLLLAVGGRFEVFSALLPATVVAGGVEPGHQRDRLYVLVHGLEGHPKGWIGVREMLLKEGDVLAVRYPAFLLSNAHPADVAAQIDARVQQAVAARDYKQIVLVGHSMGASIMRQAFLVSATARTKDYWAARVSRIVLSAGTNRGWDISGIRPSDMSLGRYVQFWIGSWFGRLTGTARLILEMQAGAPFIANLRLDWMRWYRDPGSDRPPVVQLLGDIDDIVTDEDNKDLRANGSTFFTWLRVRGTGHADVLDFSEKKDGLGKYRGEKFKLAVLGPMDAVRRENEEQAFQTDDDVTHIVFVVHGIRDLGRWAAQFEQELLLRFRPQQGEGGKAKLAVASLRYGFYGMGPFLFRLDRQQYVRWFMDRYTETLARYPNARTIDFVGHSNGTYLLASALEHYSSLRVRRIVFAGSVVRADYDWAKPLAREQVQFVRNYVASDDWVVALFPRFFEQRLTRFLRNDLGSAGFNGFSAARTITSGAVRNVEYITGAHSGFQEHIGQIVEFLLPAPQDVDVNPPVRGETAARQGIWALLLKFVSDWATGLVWLGLAAFLVWFGARVAGPAGQFAWLAAAIYLALIVIVLRGV